MLEREVDFAEMSTTGRFSFTFPQGLTSEDAGKGVRLHDAQGNECHAKFVGIQSQRDYTLTVVEVEVETWKGGLPPANFTALRTL